MKFELGNFRFRGFGNEVSRISEKGFPRVRKGGFQKFGKGVKSYSYLIIKTKFRIIR